MCILPMKAGAKETTILQTFAHNMDTALGDCAFAEWWFLGHRNTMTPAEMQDAVESVNYIRFHLEAAYKRAGKMWSAAMCKDCTADPAFPEPQEHKAAEPDWTPIVNDPVWTEME